MDSNAIGGIIGLLVFFVLPIIIGLIFIFKAQALVRSRLRFLTNDNPEPSDAAITRYRVIGGIFIIAPIVIFALAILAIMNQHSW